MYDFCFFKEIFLIYLQKGLPNRRKRLARLWRDFGKALVRLWSGVGQRERDDGREHQGRHLHASERLAADPRARGRAVQVHRAPRRATAC